MPSRRRLLGNSAALSSLLLAACGTQMQGSNRPTAVAGGAQATAAPAGQAAQSAGAGKPGGTLKMALWQEPTHLNKHMNSQTVGTLVARQIFSHLIDVDESGTYTPMLALEVPTVQNGGVSADGKMVTYKLRRDVKWHDGTPFTAKDVVFTWQARMDASNPVNSRAGYKDIDAVEAKDDYTAVVRYKSLYAPYLDLFGWVLPAHVFGGKTTMDKADFNRKPIGTGPFKFVEWVSGDHVTLAKFGDYWKKGAPLLEQVIFRFTPSREVAVAQLRTGEVDVVWNLIESNIPDLQSNPDIDLWANSGTRIERLVLNLGAPSGAQQGDPNTRHPFLGDPKVREAIELAINKKELVDKLLYGKATVGTGPVVLGWAAPKLSASEFNPDKAKKLLDDAGWKPGADGIRVKDGVRAAMTYSTTSGDNLRELTQQVMQERLRTVGVALEIKNMPSAVLLGTWGDNSPRSRGNFDINMWTTNADTDPHSHLFSYYHSSQIPSEANRGEGQNYSRLKSPDVDKAIEEGGSTVDQAKRKAAYERAVKAIVESRAHIFLYNRLDVEGARKYVKGHKYHPWDTVAWDLENWWLNK